MKLNSVGYAVELATVLPAMQRSSFANPKGKPWTVKTNQRVILDAELVEYICEIRDAMHYVGAN